MEKDKHNEHINIFKYMGELIKSIKVRDPAARGSLEIFLLYPGFRAVMHHKFANFFFRHKMFFIARYISQRARHKTGIEIHPGAKIGRRLFIDHGMGVVIGETAEIGDDCVIYQGVTLGGTGKDVGKRHPTIGNRVVIGSGAKILGPFTVGDNSLIGAGAVVLSPIPPCSTAVGVPARIVKQGEKKLKQLDHVHIPDPAAQELCRIKHRLSLLEQREMNRLNNTLCNRNENNNI